MSIEKAIERIEKHIESLCSDLDFQDQGVINLLIPGLMDILKSESVSPCENCKALETKIEQMRTDHALEQLDRNMAKDRNGN